VPGEKAREVQDQNRDGDDVIKDEQHAVILAQKIVVSTRRKPAGTPDALDRYMQKLELRRFSQPQVAYVTTAIAPAIAADDSTRTGHDFRN
jgi:hypothetical protein